MATSLGYILMNWTSTFSKKKRNRRKLKSAIMTYTNDVETDVPNESSHCSSQTEEQQAAAAADCAECQEKAQHLADFLDEIEAMTASTADLRQKLNASKLSLSATMEREFKLKSDHESLILEEAQVRYELDELTKKLGEKLDERDQAHAERFCLLEQMLQDKECDWARKNEALRRDLRQAIRSSINDTDRESESLENLEQEITSLRSVIEMRSAESRELRIHNNELTTQLERMAFLEAELVKQSHRLDEMTMILQIKMDSEKELLELSETLQQELVRSRGESMQYRHDLENRQYLYQHNDQIIMSKKNKPMLKVKHSQSNMMIENNSSQDQSKHRNEHQQASSGGNNNTGLVMNVREKTESVAWMFQMPTVASPNTQRRNITKSK
jgi:hypothetical protein